jgi:hypothetical protein
VHRDPALVYAPNGLSNTVDVISQRRLKVLDHFPVGALRQHMTPSCDLRTLHVDNDLGNSLTPIKLAVGARCLRTVASSIRPIRRTAACGRSTPRRSG